jgi:uncharacterized membrane protein YjjP (DUF1212 family)
MIAPAAPPHPTDSADFIVRLARALHEQGMACHHLESLLGRVADRLGLEAQMLSLPTAFLASFADRTEARERHVIARLDPGRMDMTKQSKLILVGRAVAAGEMTVEAGLARIQEVEGAASLPWWLQVPVAGLVSAAGGRLFGGGLAEMVGAGVIGLAVSVLTRAIRGTRAERLHDPLAAVLAALLAFLASTFVVQSSSALMVLGGLMLCLPGYALTVALDELAARHLVAGTSRLMGALTVILFLGLSVVLAEKLAAVIPARPLAVAPVLLPVWLDAAATVLGLLGLGLWFRTPARDLSWVVLFGGLAEVIERASTPHVGLPLAASLAALFLAVTCNLVARVGGKVANAVLAPALMLLLPGSFGLRALFALSGKNVLSGIETAHQMLLVSAAVVTGLLLGNLFVPPAKPQPRKT